MCGIAGLAGGPAGETAALGATVAAMAGRLAHRGPDAEGVHVEEDGRTAFGHRRLAIVDLSAERLQSMASADGTG